MTVHIDSMFAVLHPKGAGSYSHQWHLRQMHTAVVGRQVSNAFWNLELHKDSWKQCETYHLKWWWKIMIYHGIVRGAKLF